MNDTAPILEVRDLLVRRGGVDVLHIDNLVIQNGETLSLIGPNGAGKSTLLLALGRLIPAAGGAILFKGEAIHGNNGIIDYRRKLAMVFQEPLLFDATVYDNVAAGLKIRGVKKSAIHQRVAFCLAHFGISHLVDRHARKLSGGEAQRTSLARAFAVEPEIILLDEPFSSLDPPTRESLIEDLQRILKDTKTTALLTTHDRIEALRISDRMAVMKEGQIIQIGHPELVMNQPVDEFVASFIGMETILTGDVVETGPGTVLIDVDGRIIEAIGTNSPGEQVTCCIRPEQITLSLGSVPDATSARNTYNGIIKRVIPLGLFYKVFLDCGFCITAYVTAASVENLMLREELSVTVSFKATAVHMLKTRVAA